MNDMMSRLNQIMQMVKGRDPEKVFREMAKQRGLTDEDMERILAQARNASREMGYIRR